MKAVGLEGECVLDNVTGSLIQCHTMSVFVVSLSSMFCATEMQSVKLDEFDWLMIQQIVPCDY